MPLRTDVYYRGLAQKALEDAGLGEPPIPLAELAGHLGVPVRSYALPGFFTAALVMEHGMPVILLNGARNDVLRRVGLAHVLGHLIIALEGSDEGFPRDQDHDHREAAVVGGELVLPSNVVLDQSRKWFNDYRYLARLFAVAESEMLGKMKEMGLIRDRGLYWDY